MWISQIELTNFKSYQHQIFYFPQNTRDKNIVLVGGMNGFGKTTILEAIYLGLYGAEAIIHGSSTRDVEISFLDSPS